MPGSSRSIDFLRLSGWRRRVLGAVGIAVVAALIGAIFQGAGSPEVIDGRYFRNDHGDLTEIDRDEWLHLHTLESRIVAGHVLVFGLAGGLHLTQPA